MRRYKKNQRLEVYWLDTVQDPKWQTKEGMEKEPDALCLTIGYYYKHDKQYLYISHTISGRDRDKTTIPLGAIKRTVRLGPV
jgi:hypothetical protein